MDPKDLPLKLVDECGGYARAVELILSVSRSLREVAFSHKSPLQPSQSGHPYWQVDLNDLQRTFKNDSASADGALLATILRHIRVTGLSGDPRYGEGKFRRSVFQPLTLARELLRGVRPDHELRYFAMVSLRRQWRRSLSFATAHEFQLLTDILNTAINLRADYDRSVQFSYGKDHTMMVIKKWEELKSHYAYSSKQSLGHSQSWDYLDICEILNQAESLGDRGNWKSAIQIFLECCFAVNYIQAHSTKTRWIVLRTNVLDSAFLMSNLFGMATGISGFDELFGGGGLILADGVVPEDNHNSIGGRAVLTLGRYGTGKSLLCMQFAVEVARKGGLAYVMTVEQSPQECLYALGAICALPPTSIVEIAVDSASAKRILEHPRPGRGALLLINPLRESYRDFWETFKLDLKRIQKYPLRLVIVDAISALPREGDKGRLRGETLQLLHAAKQAGTNLWLVAEETSDKQDSLLYYENISDTVIRLSAEQTLPYSQRYFEITKSRFQREQRGRHSFSIMPSKGFTIYPSAAAVSARIRPRSIRPPDTFIEFGLPNLDTILGKNALCAGDVIVVQGPTGTFKTPLGLLFLLMIDKPLGGFALDRKVESLLIAAEDNPASIHQMLPRLPLDPTRPKKTGRDIRVCSLSGGYIKPGYILHTIEEEFLAARLARRSIDRVLIDNISHWGLSCPFVQQERTFGDTLVDLLRRHQVTTLFTCNDIDEPNSSALQQTIINSADCLIQLKRIEFRGSYHVMLQVLKTRGMHHRKEAFELVVGHQQVDVNTNPSLLRIAPDGRVEPLRIRLFLHNRSDAQRRQNDQIISAIRSIVSPDAVIDKDVQDSSALVRAWGLGPASALDELQVLQMDEFQMPDLSRDPTRSNPLHVFNQEQWHSEWDDLVPKLRRRIHTKKGQFIGVPLYVNIGLLVARSQHMGPNWPARSWAAIAEQCSEWEESNNDLNLTYFDFNTSEPENYNCLFLEILLSLLSGKILGQPSLEEWLAKEEAVEAALIFRRLCKRTHFRKYRLAGSANNINHEAHIWRLWYSELNEMFIRKGPEVQNGIAVSSLPEAVSIAGEWYLVVPSYSSAPDVGLEVIKLLTTHDAELGRLRAGIGLPTRKSFYATHATEAGVNYNWLPDLCLDSGTVEEIIGTSFSRSSIPSYSKLSILMSSHLERIIELPDLHTGRLAAEVIKIFHNLRDQSNFIQRQTA